MGRQWGGDGAVIGGAMGGDKQGGGEGAGGIASWRPGGWRPAKIQSTRDVALESGSGRGQGLTLVHFLAQHKHIL